MSKMLPEDKPKSKKQYRASYAPPGLVKLDFEPMAATLRDQFAMAALTGIISGSRGTGPEHINLMAEIAYQMANAMMSARDKK